MTTTPHILSIYYTVSVYDRELRANDSYVHDCAFLVRGSEDIVPYLKERLKTKRSNMNRANKALAEQKAIAEKEEQPNEYCGPDEAEFSSHCN